MVIPGVTSSDWSLSLEGVGKLVQGQDDIDQCIEIILKTTPGSDPFRPYFGCDALDKVDLPLNRVKSEMTASIITALDLWEPRIKVVRVTSEITDGIITFFISYTLKSSTNLVPAQTSVSFGLK